jgi:hypothetical protein
MTGRSLLFVLALLLPPGVADAGTNSGRGGNQKSPAAKKKTTPSKRPGLTQSGMGPTARPALSQSARPTQGEKHAVGEALRRVDRAQRYQPPYWSRTVTEIARMLTRPYPGGVRITPYQVPARNGGYVANNRRSWNGLVVSTSRKVGGQTTERRLFFDRYSGEHLATIVSTTTAEGRTERYYKGTTWLQTTQYGGENKGATWLQKSTPYGKSVRHWRPGVPGPRPGYGYIRADLNSTVWAGGLVLSTSGLGL